MPDSHPHSQPATVGIGLLGAALAGAGVSYAWDRLDFVTSLVLGLYGSSVAGRWVWQRLHHEGGRDRRSLSGRVAVTIASILVGRRVIASDPPAWGPARFRGRTGVPWQHIEKSALLGIAGILLVVWLP